MQTKVTTITTATGKYLKIINSDAGFRFEYKMLDGETRYECLKRLEAEAEAKKAKAEKQVTLFSNLASSYLLDSYLAN